MLINIHCQLCVVLLYIIYLTSVRFSQHMFEVTKPALWATVLCHWRCGWQKDWPARRSLSDFSLQSFKATSVGVVSCVLCLPTTYYRPTLNFFFHQSLHPLECWTNNTICSQEFMVHECAPAFNIELFRKYLGHKYDIHVLKWPAPCRQVIVCL